MNPKKPAKIQHLVNWYFGNFCAKCKRINMENEIYGRRCYDKLKAIGNGIKVEEMTHKEFVMIIRSSTFCKPIKRVFKDCQICKALGVSQRRM